MSHDTQQTYRTTTERLIALSHVGTALMHEHDEARVLHLIAQTACDLLGADFAAFSLRPINEEGMPLVSSAGQLFYLAAIVSHDAEYESLVRRISLSDERLLAPVFREGIPVLVTDAFAQLSANEHHFECETTAQAGRGDDTQGACGMRSLLGAPLLDRCGQVSGGLILGHTAPGQFTEEDQSILLGLAGQAIAALENARLQWIAQQLRVKTQLIDLAHDAIVVRDPASRILSWNKGAEQLYGWTAQEAKGHTTSMRLQTCFPVSREAIDDQLEQTGKWEGKLTHTCRDRGQVTVESRQVLVRDDDRRPIAILEINRDITERLRLEQLERDAHAETEVHLALLQMIIDELPSSVYLVRGHDARLVIANQAASKVWGASWAYDQPLQEFLAEHRIRLFNSTGQLLSPCELATMRALQDGEVVRQQQEIIRHADGSSLPMLVNAVALGTVNRLSLMPAAYATQQERWAEPLALVMHQDVTALKETEYLKDEFIAIAAHELRNPVTALVGFAQTLLSQTSRGRGTPLVPWQQDALQEIDLASARLVTLIEELLDVTRLQAGQLFLQKGEADIVELSRRVVKRLQMTTERHHLSLHMSSSRSIVSLDAGRIEQVLSNLLTNAIKYSPDGGHIEVQVDEDRNVQEALVQIRDCGIGIPTGQQAQIFSRFMRADNAQEAGISGTGLGLYLCRELVELHGGRIWFESTEGEGSTFFLALPLSSGCF